MHKVCDLFPEQSVPRAPHTFIFISMAIKHGSESGRVNGIQLMCEHVWTHSVCVGPRQHSVHSARLLPSRQTFSNTVRDSQSNGLCAGVIQQRSGDSFSGVAAQIKAPNMKKKNMKGQETQRVNDNDTCILKDTTHTGLEISTRHSPFATQIPPWRDRFFAVSPLGEREKVIPLQSRGWR